MDTVSYSAAIGNIPNTSGIYKITCIANKKFYIGSATNLRKRKNSHIRALQQNKHYNPHMQNAWNKYGGSTFTFEILELVLVINLTAREQYWLNKLQPFAPKGFNVAHDASSTLGFKHSSEYIERSRQGHLGKKLSPEHIEAIRKANTGRKATPEQIEKRRQAMTGREFSPEHREKLRQAALKRTSPSPEHMEKMRQSRRKKHSPKTIKKSIPYGTERRRQVRLGIKHTPEAIKKMKQTQSTPEAIERKRQTSLGNTYTKGRNHSPEFIEKMKQSANARKRDERGKFI